MGQKYSEKTYKKSYTNDYNKTYKRQHSYELPLEEEKKTTKDSVAPEGNKRRMYQKPIGKSEPMEKEANTYKEKVRPKPVSDIRQEAKIEVPPQIPSPKVVVLDENTPPPFNPTLQKIYNREIELDNVDYSVEYLGGNKYKDVLSDSEINEVQARELLRATGFFPKSEIQVSVLFICILAIVFFSYFGVGIAFYFAIRSLKKKNTTFIKRKKNSNLRFTMPATAPELLIYRSQAILCFIIAIVGAIIKTF